MRPVRAPRLSRFIRLPAFGARDVAVAVDLRATTFVIEPAVVGPGAAMLAAGLADIAQRGHRIVVAAQEPFLAAADGHPDWQAFTSRDDAVAWCEDRLLAGEAPLAPSAPS